MTDLSHPQLPVHSMDTSRIADKALQILLDNLQTFGNTISAQQRIALHRYLYSLACKILNPTGTTVYSPPCGDGKTQAIIALCAALHRLGFHDKSLLIATSKVEALCEIKRHLIKNNLPQDIIGLRHSYQYQTSKAENFLSHGEVLPAGFASEPCTVGNDQRQFLLTTQIRAKSVRNGDLDYMGQPRQLLIWDESLLNTSFNLSKRDLKRSIGWIAPSIGENTKVIQYLNSVLDMMEAEITRQEAGDPPQLMKLPDLSDEEAEYFKSQLKTEQHTKCLMDLLDRRQSELRVAIAGNQHGFIGYWRNANAHVDSIAILDASYPIRDLEQMDNNIQPDSSFTSAKRYDHVTIHCLKRKSGRTSVLQNLGQRRREDRTISHEVGDAIARRIPANEGIILLNFKLRTNETDAQKKLQADLRAIGIDLDAKINVKVRHDAQWVKQQKPRFIWLTWGQETSLSSYAYCKHVIFVGVLQRSYLDIAAAIAGQKDDLLTELPLKLLQQVATSEAAHCVYQGMHRGACRINENDQAQEMHAWLIHNDDERFKALINRAMPGVKWEWWLAKLLVGLQSRTAADIRSFLARLQADTISVQALKKQAGLKDVNAKTFTRSLEQALEGSGWEKHSRTLKRTTRSGQ